MMDDPRAGSPQAGGVPSAEALDDRWWIAGAAFVYVAAWLIGLAIGFATGSPGPTDTRETIGAYFGAHRQLAMLQA
jgi:hypothetical protein